VIFPTVYSSGIFFEGPLFDVGGELRRPRSWPEGVENARPYLRGRFLLVDLFATSGRKVALFDIVDDRMVWDGGDVVAMFWPRPEDVLRNE
jgi:hypothetical protein